jgi:hypothetical protein
LSARDPARVPPERSRTRDEADESRPASLDDAEEVYETLNDPNLDYVACLPRSGADIRAWIVDQGSDEATISKNASFYRP